MKKSHKYFKMILVKILTLIITIFVIFSLISTSSLSSIENNTFDELDVKNNDITHSTGLAPQNGAISEYIPKSHLGELMKGYITSSSIYDEGPCYFDVDDPGNIEYLKYTDSIDFLSGGTGVQGHWIACENFTGALWEIDPDNGEMTYIGGGGVGLTGLAHDLTTNFLYGCSASELYTIDPDDGDQELIGSFGSNVEKMIGIACDSDGVLYGWDLGDKLWMIDCETGETEEIGPLGIDLNYAQDGGFNWEEEIFYLTAYTVSPYYGSYLYECDKETGECELIGQIEGNSQITASVISLGWYCTKDDVGIKEIVEPQDGYAVDPINPEVLVKNYGNSSEVTDVQFDIMKCETGPILLEEHFDSWPPEGWSYYGYEQSNTNNATGTPPEAYYGYYSGHCISNGYLMTPEMNCSGYEKINIKFKCLGEFNEYYTPYFYLRYRKNPASSWRDVSSWDNPITGDLGPDQYEIGCYGWGEDLGDEFQAQWYLGSYYYYLLYGSGIYIDDVIIEGCSGCLDYSEVIEDVEVPWDSVVSVEFPDWTPSEWHNESYQDTWEEYPLTAYTLLEDDNQKNNKKQRLLSLYYPWLHDVGVVDFDGPKTGPAQTFPICATIKNVGQYDECCFTVYVAISEIDFTYANELLEEYFPSSKFPPPGWASTNTKWDAIYGSYAGGSPYEARFYWSPSETGMFRLYTPPIDTSGYGVIQIQFKHYVNNYNGHYTLRVETSQDAVSWTSVWDIPGGSYGPETIEIMTGENVGDQTIVSWTYDGNSYNINYWCVDDVVIKGIPVTESEYEDEVCVEDIQPGEEILYEFDDWTPEFLEQEESGVKNYLCKAWTELDDPQDNNHANDAFQKAIKLKFFHDVEVTAVTSPTIGVKGDQWYAYNAYDPTGQLAEAPITFESDNPGDVTLLKPTSSSNFIAGAVWVDCEWIGCQYDTGQIWKIDLYNGDMENIGGGGSGLNGLAYDYRTHTMYGASFYNLYEIDSITGSQYLIGSWGSSYLAIAIAIDIDGICYIHDIVTESIYIIDLETGEATLLGPTGISGGGYGGDMAYDIANNLMYLSWSGQLYEMDMENGHCTLIGGFQNGIQVTGFAIPPWDHPFPDTYITSGTQEIEVLTTNLGTFPEENMTCYAEIYEYITNCTNGTLVYKDNITDINIEEPLGGTQTLLFDDYKFEFEGPYVLFIKLEDDNDDDPQNNEMIWGICVDDTAPNSGHTLDPLAPNGENGYYVSDVTVTVNAMDPSIGCEEPGSGVKEIRYNVDGEAGVIPGALGYFDITTDGNDIEVEYWAIDNVGNTESKNSFTIDMDQTVPEIDVIMWEAEKDGLLAPWMITFNCYADDETAGMDRVEMYINEGFYENVEGPGPEYKFEIQWSPVFKRCNFKFIHYDKAGLFSCNELWGGNIQAFAYMDNIKSSKIYQEKSEKLLI